jgi:predicted nucleic acid-binding protein
MYLLDTNVLSELRKGTRADPALMAFFAGQDENRLYLAVQTIGEIQGGIQRLRHRNDQKQAQILEHWLYLVMQQYNDRILNFDTDCAQMWGSLMALDQHNPVDKQIAAIALIHNLTVLTRNSRDFARLGVKWLNPFAPDANPAVSPAVSHT